MSPRLFSFSLLIMIGACTLILRLPSVSAQSEESGAWKNLVHELNLSEEQKRKILEIRRESKAEEEAKRSAVAQAQASLRSAMAAQKSDEELLREYTRLLQLENDFRRAQFNQNLRVRALLNPEQRNRFSSIYQSTTPATN